MKTVDTEKMVQAAKTVKSNTAVMRMEKSKASKQRESSDCCPVYKKCSGCSLRNMTYEEQLKFKYVKIDRLMGKLCRPDRVIGMEDTRGYRSKVSIAYDFAGGRAVSGIYRSAKGGVTAVKSCPVNDPRANAVGSDILEIARELKIPVYSCGSGRGFLRHALIRTAGNTGDMMCVVTGAGREFPEKREFTRRLINKHPEITSLYFSVSTSEKMTSGGCFERLYGKEFMEDIICGKGFRISPDSFAQVNPRQTEVLYGLAMKYADIKPRDTVIDAYCGIGTLTVLAAERAGYVYGCEINPSAASDGGENLKKNGITNARIVCGDSGKFLQEFLGGGLSADIVILDPARAGCDKRFLANLAKISPRRIVYISCNPETQARDVFFLVQRGYKVKKLSPVDMFPHTGHVECVGLLSKG